MKKIICCTLFFMHMHAVEINIINNEDLSQFNEVHELYNLVGYTNKILTTDQILTAVIDNKIVGAVRLCFEANMYILRGMEILPEYQRQGIGTQLLNKLDEYIGSNTCWCLAHSWLENFYGQIGFKKIEKDQAPLVLQKRINSYKDRFPQLIIMVKNLKLI